MRDVSDYTLVQGELEEVEADVSSLISQGWQPWGPPPILHKPGLKSPMVTQALVVYSDRPPDEKEPIVLSTRMRA